MRFSAVLAGLGAALVAASPVHKALHKKAVEVVYDVVTEIDWVTVTEGALPKPTPPAVKIQTVVVSTTVYVNPIPAPKSTHSEPPPPPPPAPTTTSTSIAPPPPPPAPTTSTVEAPAPPPPPPAPATTQEAAPQIQVQQAAPTVAAVAAPAPVSTNDYQSAAINSHNVHRANHSAPDVSWSDELAASALIVANTCVFAHKMDVNGGGYGQNLAAYGTSSSSFDGLNLNTVVANAVTEQWYNGELPNVPWGQNSPSINGPEFLHLTQLIWKDSVTVGCATVNCAAGTIFPIADANNPEPAWYTVCNYGPVGNILGAFNSQISRPGNAATVHAAIS